MSFADAVRAATGREIRGHERVGGGDINNAFRVVPRISTCPTRTTAVRAASRPCSTRSRPRAVACSMSFADAVRAATGREIRGHERVGGGDINNAFRVQFEDESFGFVKTRADVAPGEYEAEAAGLRWLAEPGALRVPEVLGVSDDVLVLDWVDEGGRGDAGGVRRRPGGACTRRAPSDFGRPAGGRCASGRCCSRTIPRRTGRRSTPRAGCGRCSPARLPPSGRAAVERVCERIADLAGPPEPPARLHGDLWSGNVLWGRDGTAWLIDPAAYGGHREVDLAMLQLFGDPGRQFFAAYDERFPLAPATRSACRCTNCSRCSSTPRCSAAATAPQPSAPLASTSRSRATSAA